MTQNETMLNNDEGLTKLYNDSFELWRATHSKYPRDNTKDGTRNFAHSMLDDYLFHHLGLTLKNKRGYEISFEVNASNEDVIRIGLLESTEHVDIEFSSITYDGRFMSTNGMTELNGAELELLEDILRIVYKHEFNGANSHG